MYKVFNVIWILVFLSIFSINFAQEDPCDEDKVQVKIITADTVTCVDEDTAESWIESDFAILFDGESEQQNSAQQKPAQQESVQEEFEQEESVQEESVQEELEQQMSEQQESRQQEPEKEVESELDSEINSESVAEESCVPGKVKVRIINADEVVCAEEDTADLWIQGGFAAPLEGESQQRSGRVMENPCDPEEVWVKIVNSDTVSCVDKDTSRSWIESSFAVVFNGKFEQKPEQQKSEQQEPKQEIAENSCGSNQVQVKLIEDGTVRCVEKTTADLWIEGNFAVALDGRSEQEPKEEQQKESETEAVQQTNNESDNKESSKTENPCDRGQVQVKLVQDDSVRCAEKNTATLWIEGNFAVAFNGEPEQESGQEAQSESDSEERSEIAEESPCGLREVQIKLIKDDSVRCVERDVADSWIESNFAVAVDKNYEQRSEQQEPEQQEPEQEAQSESDSEVSSEAVKENPCYIEEVWVKIVNSGTVTCVDKNRGNSWIESGFAIVLDEEFEQKLEQQKSEQKQEQEPEQEAQNESDGEDGSETAKEISCDSEEVRVKIVNADSVVCVDEDTAKSWIESDFAVKF